MPGATLYTPQTTASMRPDGIEYQDIDDHSSFSGQRRAGLCGLSWNLILTVTCIVFFSSTVALGVLLGTSNSAAASGAIIPTTKQQLPIMGWNPWNSFFCKVNETLLKDAADRLQSSGLLDAGYNYFMIDDCWQACNKYSDKKGEEDGYCLEPVGRDANGDIQADPIRFPSGMKNLADYVHSKGMKFGIYTSMNALTCAGFMGSEGYEAHDANTFMDWGVDFIKVDFCLSLTPEGAKSATEKISNAVRARGRDVIVYMDGETLPRVYDLHYNPINTEKSAAMRTATDRNLLAQVWAPTMSYMWKMWKDIRDDFWSTIDNALHTTSMSQWTTMGQKCGGFNFPDMLTVGIGAQTDNEYHVQMDIWSVLGTPLIMGHDLQTMTKNTTDILTNQYRLNIQKDPKCVAGSLASIRECGHTWVKPLATQPWVPATASTNITNTQGYAVAMVNVCQEPKNLTLYLKNWFQSDFFPAEYLGEGVTIYDVLSNTTLGTYQVSYSVTVEGHSSKLLFVEDYK